MPNHHRISLSDPLSFGAIKEAIAPLQVRSVQPIYLKERYRILNIIGQGGFGRTFLAIDEAHSLPSPCVIKQLFLNEQNTALQQKAVEQFHQEALQLAELGSHCQIPQLLDFFEQDGHCYLVQEWIDGQNLEQELSQSTCFNEAEIRQLLYELLPVLQFIHDRQVIHRDIKPANIVRRRGDQRFTLVDFGAAKHLSHVKRIGTETLIGSAEYAAPEQVRGYAVFASDLYSLGVTCLYLLTQTHPFDLYDSGENDWNWQAYLAQPISSSLKRVLTKLLQPAIRQRYQSVAEVLAELDKLPPLTDTSQQGEGVIESTVLSTQQLDSSALLAADIASPAAIAMIKTVQADNSTTAATIYSPKKGWYRLSEAETSDLARKMALRLGPRLAAAASIQQNVAPSSDAIEFKPISESRLRSRTEVKEATNLVFRMMALFMMTCIGSMALICTISSLEHQASSTSLRLQSSLSVPNHNR